MRRKFETVHFPDGRKSVRQLGWVAEERLESDVQQEKEHFTRISMRDDFKDGTKSIEHTEDVMVVFYESGRVRVIQWVVEKQ